MVDLHCHVLPGIDDGPREIEASLAICRASEALGVTTIVATPHVSWRYENDSAGIAARVALLNEELERERIGVEVLAGAEVAIFKAVELDDDELRALCLGGGQWLLAEPPFTAGAEGLAAMISQLRSRGHKLLIAHPERCPSYLVDRSPLKGLVDDGVLLSVTAGSLAGRFGKDCKRLAESLLRDGMVHNVASDAHDTDRRPPGLAAELADAGYGALTDALCRDIPRALLDGSVPPPPPSAPPISRRRLGRLFS